MTDRQAKTPVFSVGNHCLTWATEMIVTLSYNYRYLVPKEEFSPRKRKEQCDAEFSGGLTISLHVVCTVCMYTTIY